MKKQFKRYIKPISLTRKRKEVPIYIRYDYDRISRTMINSGHSINPDLHWDYKKNSLKRSCPNHDVIINDLEAIENKISNILQYAKENKVDPKPEYVVNRLSTYNEFSVENNKKTDLFKSLDTFIEERKANANVSLHALHDYATMRKHLRNFEKYWGHPITFSSLNVVFYEKFLYYLSFEVVKRDKKKGLKLNTISKYIKNIKLFYNDRRRKEHLPFIDLSDFKRKNEVVDHIYLSEKEILQIWELDLSTRPNLIPVRDILVFGCYTGLRYSDIYSLMPYHFKKIVIGDEIHIAIQKNQNKVHEKVNIALIHLAKTVAEKYEFNLPKIFMNEFNILVKDLGKLAGFDQEVALSYKFGRETREEVFKKYKLMASHICRRSFATNMYLRGISPEIIMTNTGHSSLKTLSSYIKISKQEKAYKLFDYFSEAHEINVIPESAR
jgi:integrase